MEETIFVQHLFFSLDPAWHRLLEEERRCTQAEFTQAIETDATIRTYTYTTGLKAGTDLLLWRIGPDLAEFQATTNRLLKTRPGVYISSFAISIWFGSPFDLYTAAGAGSAGTGAKLLSSALSVYQDNRLVPTK
jgi:chlorite dismutase